MASYVLTPIHWYLKTSKFPKSVVSMDNIFDNLLTQHPDGAGEYIIAAYLDYDRHPPWLVEMQIKDSLYEDREIIILVHTPNNDTLILFFDADLHQVEDAVSRGNSGIDEWVNSEAGIHYRNTVLEYLNVDIENSTFEVKYFPATGK